MTAALAHRGPDGEGFHADGPVAFGHRRLSIIDLAGGAQPMFNEDGTVCVVANGEIYNYRELREELKGHHSLRTDSDIEVLLHLYEDCGEDFVPRLRGMFSFALWDSRARKLVCARDRYGEKPFLYAPAPDGLSFASELRAFEAPGSLDRAALSDFLELLYVPAPRTIYAGVRKLPAGHLLVADERGIRVRRYWDLPVPGSREVAPSVDTPAELRRRMEEAVRLQLRSDVPVAALLSGGLDSSTVVALMARELGAGVQTFSVGFGRDDDELPYAREVARRFETEHHELMVTDDAATQAAEALGAYSEPFGDSSSVPTVAVCREVARHVKVVLTGDGGDELFAGYGRYRQVESLPHLAGARAALPLLADAVPRARSLRRAVQTVDAAGGERYRALLEVFPAAEREALLGGPTDPAPYVDLPGSADAAMAFDLGVYLPDDLLVKVDIASMHSSLESRAPFLDPRIGELVIPFPAGAKQDRDAGKRMLKVAMEDLLPPAILHRAKRGFGSPVEQWLQGPLRPLMEDLLAAPSAKVRDLLDGRQVDRVLEGARTGRGNAHQAWALLAFESWLRRPS